MSYIVNGKSVKNVGLITEPSSYGLTATPENMQAGTTAVVNGKLVEGTGKAFEFARYGQELIDTVLDENGIERYGIMVKLQEGGNLFFLSSDFDGDSVAQQKFIFDDIREGTIVNVGKNTTMSCDVYAFCTQGYVCIYSVDISSINTVLNYFMGKDNQLL